MSLPAAAPSTESARVLTKALVRAARSLGLSQRVLAGIVGISESSASRLRRGRLVDPDTKEGELALLFLRVYRSLDALLGGDAEACRKWMHADNRHLGAVPADLVGSVSGLVRVADYLDAMRGKS
jgi:transcriptional regulator with XRE-family HTH domain